MDVQSDSSELCGAKVKPAEKSKFIAHMSCLLKSVCFSVDTLVLFLMLRLLRNCSVMKFLLKG